MFTWRTGRAMARAMQHFVVIMQEMTMTHLGGPVEGMLR
jgi:hypothetical protein